MQTSSRLNFFVQLKEFKGPDHIEVGHQIIRNYGFSGPAALASFIQMKLRDGFDMETATDPREDHIVFRSNNMGDSLHVHTMIYSKA